MKKSSAPEKVVSGSVCAGLVEKTRAVRKIWANLESSLDGCFVKTSEPESHVLDPFALLRAIAEARSKAILVTQLGEASLSEAETWAREAAQAATLSFDGELRNLCARDKFSLEGRFPSYLVEGYVEVRLSVDDGVSMIGSKKVKSLFAKRIWVEIASSIEEERLRQVTLTSLLAWFQRAYQSAIAGRNERIGVSIPIKDLFRELAIMLQHQKPSSTLQGQRGAKYTEEYFRRDLSRLMAAGEFVTSDGARMELLPTAFAKEGVPVTIGEGVRIIGRVAFGEPLR
jgi:hypothetical protein